MALKYWYVAGNGSAAWSVAGNWYNGSGGTGGVAGVPTTADDAVVNAASGSGTLTIGGTSTCNSLNTKDFTGTLAGSQALNIVTSSVVNNGGIALQLGGTHNYSGTITFTSSSFTSLDIQCNGIFHKGNMTFNSSNGAWAGSNSLGYDPIRLTGVLNLLAGNISSNELYAGTFSSSNVNNRNFGFDDIYLSGTGTLFNVSTQTNLTAPYINNAIYLTSTVSLSKTLALSGVVYAPNIYLQGSGTAATNITSTSTAGYYPNIFISKTGGSLQFNTSSIFDLTFIEGTTITWSSTSAQLTVYGSITLCNSLTVVSTNNLLFAGGVIGNSYQAFTTFNKTFTGWLQVNDSGNYTTTLEVYGNYTSTTISTNPPAINILSCAYVAFYGSVNLTTSININGLITGSYAIGVLITSITLATSLTIANASVQIGNSTLSNNLQFNSGYLEFLQNSTINIFSLTSNSTSTPRELILNNANINLNGNSGTIWNINGFVQGVLNINQGTSTINITDKTLGSVSFTGGSAYYNNLIINRSNNFVNNTVYTVITGNNGFNSFKDLTINPNGTEHYIAFASSSTTYIFDTFQVGNSVNLTRLVQTASAAFVLYKVNLGLVICPNVYIGNSSVGYGNTWYAISGSLNAGGNTGWIFDTPPRRLGSLGAG